MKRIVAVLIIALMLVGCGGSKIQSEIKQHANSAVAAAESYLGGTISAQSAYDLVSAEYDAIEEIDDGTPQVSILQSNILGIGTQLTKAATNEIVGLEADDAEITKRIEESIKQIKNAIK